MRSTTAAAIAAVVLFTAAPLAAAPRLDWPSLTAAAAGQVLGDGGTTAMFLTGHGQSVSHPGPCVEGNLRFQSQAHPVASVIAAKVGLVGGLVALNYLSERLAARPGLARGAARVVRWSSRGVNYFAAGIGAGAAIYNVAHCGLL